MQVYLSEQKEVLSVFNIKTDIFKIKEDFSPPIDGALADDVPILPQFALFILWIIFYL